MSLQIFVADDWPGAPAAETPTEVAEVPSDPRTLLYLVDQHLAAVAEAQARAEAEARHQAALKQRAGAETVLQAAIEAAREQAEQEARAQALAEMAAEQELAQLVFALAQEEAVLDALGRRALLLNALPAAPVYDSMFPYMLRPESYAPHVDLDAADTYADAISALLARQAQKAKQTFHRGPDSAYDEYDEPAARGSLVGRSSVLADSDTELARYAQQASQANWAQAQAQAQGIPGYDEYGVPSAQSEQYRARDSALRQAWPGLLSFLQQRADEEDDAPPPAPESLTSASVPAPAPASLSSGLPGLQYLSFPRGDAFYAPLQSAAAARDAHRSIYLAPSSGASAQADEAEDDVEDVDMDPPGTWHILSDAPTRKAPTFLTAPRSRLPRRFVRHDSPSTAVSRSDEADEDDEDDEAGLDWLAQEILRARLQASKNDGGKPGVVVLDDGSVGDNAYDAPATPARPRGRFLFDPLEPVSRLPSRVSAALEKGQGEFLFDDSEPAPAHPALDSAVPAKPQDAFLFERSEPVSDQPSASNAAAAEHKDKPTNSSPPIPALSDEARLSAGLANEFGAGLPIQTPVAVEEPALSPKPAPLVGPGSGHSRTSSRARATTVMDEDEEDELEGRPVQARKLQRV